MLYSFKGNYPESIPSRIRLPTGTTRTDSATFTDELLELCGYIAVPDKPQPSIGNDIVEWNDTAWIERPYTQQEKDEIKFNKINGIKEEARRRILKVYPEWKQANMTARAVELQDIWRINQSWSVDEQYDSDALKAAWAWIKNIRHKSNLLEAMDPIPDDYTDDKYWTV